MLAGKFSIPFAVATTIVHGSTGVASFRSQAIDNPAVQDLARRVFVTEDPKLTAMMPARRPSRVRMTLQSGERLDAEVFMNKGDFEDPYGPGDLKKKYYSLVDTVWPHEKAEKVYASILSLEQVKDVHEMTRLIAPAP
jgi:2-methylcitrate dehydratase PrpD